MRILGIIPARFASSRFPGKPLVNIGGKSMIRRVYEQVSQTERVEKVVVATDDRRIYDHILEFGGQALMTGTEHRSGTDRCAEVAEVLPEFDIIVNVQGDEPFIQPQQIELAVQPLLDDPACQIATLAKKISDPDLIQNPHIVKVVFNNSRRALYFSRSPLPYVRNRPPENWPKVGKFYKHIGLYAFKSSVLRKIAALPPSPLEKLEGLEQLRWLENGYAIQVSLTKRETIGVDTPEDLERVQRLL